MSYLTDPTKIWNLPYNGVSLKQGPPVQLANAGAGNVTAGDHDYVVTFVEWSNEETLPGEASDILTTSAGNGKALVRLPDYADDNVTGFHIYRKPAAGGARKRVTTAGALAVATYKGKWYLDDVADASLGADAPTANATNTPIEDPPIGRALIEALTVGTFTDFLVAYFVVGRRWVLQQTAGNNAAVLVPGSFQAVASAAPGRWATGDYLWVPTADPTGVVPIPTYSASMANHQEILMALRAMGKPMIIDYDAPRTITAPSGAKSFVLTTTDDELVALTICQAALMAACDVAE